MKSPDFWLEHHCWPASRSNIGDFCQDILDEYDAKAKTPAVRFSVNLSVCRMAFYSYQMICQRESQNSGQSRKERETNIWTIFLLVEQLL